MEVHLHSDNNPTDARLKIYPVSRVNILTYIAGLLHEKTSSGLSLTFDDVPHVST